MHTMTFLFVLMKRSHFIIPAARQPHGLIFRTGLQRPVPRQPSDTHSKQHDINFTTDFLSEAGEGLEPI